MIYILQEHYPMLLLFNIIIEGFDLHLRNFRFSYALKEFDRQNNSSW